MKTKILTISLIASTFVFGASFDCKRATTPTEKAICTNATLSSMDDALLNAYRYATTYSNQDISKIKTTHNIWVNQKLINCNGIKKCIYGAMVDEIQYLSRTVPVNTKIIRNTNVSNKANIDLSYIPQIKDKQLANVPITSKMLYALTYTISENNPNLARFEFNFSDTSKNYKSEYVKVINFLKQNKISFKEYKSPQTQIRKLNEDHWANGYKYPNLVYIDIPNCTIALFNKINNINGSVPIKGNMGLALEGFNFSYNSNMRVSDLSTKTQYLNLISELKELANRYSSTKNAKANTIESLFLNNTYSSIPQLVGLPEYKTRESFEDGKAGELVTVTVKDRDMVTYGYERPVYDYNTISPNFTLPIKYHYYNEFQKNYKKLWGENY